MEPANVGTYVRKIIFHRVTAQLHLFPVCYLSNSVNLNVFEVNN